MPGGHGLTTTRWSRACVSWCTTPLRPGPPCWSSARVTTSSFGLPIAAVGIFHRREDGAYAGHHPADSDACIVELERLRQRGADFLLIPETALWWLQHYTRFAEHLRQHYAVRADGGAPGIVIALSERFTSRTPAAEVH